MYTVLHNPEDEVSRNWVAEHEDDPDVVEILDWYDEEERNRWVVAGGTLEVSAFPSLVYSRPELDFMLEIAVDTDDYVSWCRARGLGRDYPGATKTTRHIRERGVEVTRMVLWAEDAILPIDSVKAHQARNALAAAVSWVEAVAVATSSAQQVLEEAIKVEPFLLPVQATKEFQPPGKLEEHRDRLEAAKALDPIDPRKPSQFSISSRW